MLLIRCLPINDLRFKRTHNKEPDIQGNENVFSIRNFKIYGTLPIPKAVLCYGKLGVTVTTSLEAKPEFRD
jgi:hypothetical protein